MEYVIGFWGQGWGEGYREQTNILYRDDVGLLPPDSLLRTTGSRSAWVMGGQITRNQTPFLDLRRFHDNGSFLQ